jgi:hypothetical protein
MMVFQSSVEDIHGSHSQMLVASSHVDSEVIYIKVEELTDMKTEEDTLQMAEYEVSCECVCTLCHRVLVSNVIAY